MNLAYRDFTELAYRKAIILAMQRFLLEFISAEVSAQQTLKCEDVFAVDQDVPEEAFHAFLEELREAEEEMKRKMGQFEFRKKEKELRGSKQENQEPAIAKQAESSVDE